MTTTADRLEDRLLLAPTVTSEADVERLARLRPPCAWSSCITHRNGERPEPTA